MCVNHGVHVCTILHLCVPVCAVFVTLCFNVGFNMPVFFTTVSDLVLQQAV